MPQLPFPIDGLVYQDREQRYNIPIAGGRVSVLLRYCPERHSHFIQGTGSIRGKVWVHPDPGRVSISYPQTIPPGERRPPPTRSHTLLSRPSRSYVSIEFMRAGCHLKSCIAIMPSLNQPVRSSPLRAVNEPAVYVMGEKQGQKVFPGGGSGSGRGPSAVDRAPPPDM